MTLAPIFQVNERHAVVLARSAEAETLHREEILNGIAFILEEMFFHLLEHGHGPLLCRSDRSLHLSEERALILGGEK